MNAATRTANVHGTLGAAVLASAVTRTAVSPAAWAARRLDPTMRALRRLARLSAQSGRESADGPDARHAFAVFMIR